jgi:hypothetical protein
MIDFGMIFYIYHAHFYVFFIYLHNFMIAYILNHITFYTAISNFSEHISFLICLFTF